MRLLAISMLFAGCQKDDNTNLVALNEINLTLNGINIETRVEISNNHPTMAIPSEREDFNLKITIGTNTAIYQYNQNTGKWVPQSNPVYFSTLSKPEPVEFECFYRGRPSNDQSSVLAIQANDTLVGHIDSQLPVGSLDQVHLTHKNAVIEVVLSEKLTHKGDVYINNSKAFQETTQNYQVVIPQSQGRSQTIPFLLKDQLGVEYTTQLKLPLGAHPNTWHTFSIMLSEDFSDVELVTDNWQEAYIGEQFVQKILETDKK